MQTYKYSHRRRSQRVLLDEAVIVRGESPARRPFEEEGLVSFARINGHSSRSKYRAEDAGSHPSLNPPLLTVTPGNGRWCLRF